MTFAVDTQVLVWWIEGSRRLGRRHRDAFRRAARSDSPMLVSIMCLHEIGTLAARGRLPIPVETLREYLVAIDAAREFRVVPLTLPVALDAAALPDVISDPADRAIAATARVHEATLLTTDRRLLECAVVTTR